MVGDKYIVKEDCFDSFHSLWLRKGEILTESYGYNNETEQWEDYPDGYNDLLHDEHGWICDVGSDFAKDYLEKMQ